MTDITIAQAQRLTAPAPFGLISTLKDDGSTNLMAISWWTYLTNHPAMIGVCLSKKGLSGSLIEKNGEFALSIVGEELKEKAKKCGTCSGRTVDKAKEFGIETEKAAVVAAETVCGSRVVFECKLAGKAEAGDHVLYMGEIVALRGDPEVKQLFAFDGYARLDTV